MMRKQILQDTFRRKHDYLRIALTDKCSLRCQYCMPEENMSFFPQSKLMTAGEIFDIASVFTGLGVKKIRLTGGEPLIRNDAKEIMMQLSRLPIELCITTNVILADGFIETFKKTGIRSVNVSLDTFNAEKFLKITRRNYFHKVLMNIHLLLSHGFHVKLNVVVMRGVNDDELLDFIDFTKHFNIHIRFIEFMPFSGNAWDEDKLVTYAEMLEKIETRFKIEKLNDIAHSTSKKYQAPGYTGTFAFITTMSSPFCNDCNRMRLTADGKMKNCLFSKGEADLLTALRNKEDIAPIIKTHLGLKAAAMGGQMDPTKMENRSMILIGG